MFTQRLSFYCKTLHWTGYPIASVTRCSPLLPKSFIALPYQTSSMKHLESFSISSQYINFHFFCQTYSQLLFCSCITISSPKDKISISCFQILPVGLLLFKNSATVGCYGCCSSQFKVFMVRVTVASPRNKWRERKRDFQGAISVLL